MTLSLAMVAMGAKGSINLRALQDDLLKNWPGLPQISGAKRDENTVSFQIGTVNVAIGFIPGPIPWSDLEGPCATSALWPDSAEVLKDHRSHLIVSVFNEPSALSRFVLLTKIVASLAATSPGVLGIYWSHGSLVVSPALFRDFALEVLPSGPPIHIWIDFRVGKERDGLSYGFTTGLSALGHMELEVRSAPEAIESLHERLIAISGYLVSKGPVISDGDTVGESEFERLVIRVAPSTFPNRKDSVMHIDFHPIT